MVTRRLCLAGFVVVCLLVPAAGGAQPIPGVSIQSVSAEYTSPPWDLRAIHVVNGSGLSGGGHDVTSPAGNSWQTDTQTGTGTITFDLGVPYSLGRLHVWNLNFYAPYNGRGARDVKVSTSLDPTAWTDQGQTVFPIATGLAADPGFDVDASSWGRARYVRFEILANWGETTTRSS